MGDGHVVGGAQRLGAKVGEAEPGDAGGLLRHCHLAAFHADLGRLAPALPVSPLKA